MTTSPRGGGYLEAHSSGVLRAGHQTDPKALANAIRQTAKKFKRLQVRAAGKDAVNAAVKALILANGWLTQQGLTFFMIPSFETTERDGGGEFTVIVFNLQIITLSEAGMLYDA